MAGRLLVLIFVLVSFGLSLEYEVIKNIDRDEEIITAYFDHQEVLSLNEGDYEAFKRMYSVLGQLMLLRQLNYDVADLKFVRAGATHYALTWNEQRIVVINDSEKRLNDRRGNKISRIRRMLRKYGSSEGKARIPLVKEDLSIKTIKSAQKMGFKVKEFGPYLPAAHRFLPVGTKLRVSNPVTDWTIVVKVVENIPNNSDDILGLGETAWSALGLSHDQAIIKTQLL